MDFFFSPSRMLWFGTPAGKVNHLPISNSTDREILAEDLA